MNDENIYYDEFLQYIRWSESKKLDVYREFGRLPEYILNMHKEMIEKYPEMIVKIYTDEELEKEGRNQ